MMGDKVMLAGMFLVQGGGHSLSTAQMLHCKRYGNIVQMNILASDEYNCKWRRNN